jgi:hypothetical protein
MLDKLRQWQQRTQLLYYHYWRCSTSAIVNNNNNNFIEQNRQLQIKVIVKENAKQEGKNSFIQNSTFQRIKDKNNNQ